MSAFRNVTLTVPLDPPSRGTVAVRARQCGPLAVHEQLIPGGGNLPRLGEKWVLTHAVTGLRVPVEALESREQAEALVGLLLADTAVYRAFALTTQEGVLKAAPDDMQERLLNFRHQSVCNK